WSERGWLLRNTCQKRGFRQRELRGVLVEIGTRRRLDSITLASVEDLVHAHRENIFLGILLRHGDSRECLTVFAVDTDIGGANLLRVGRAYQLLGDCRSTGATRAGPHDHAGANERNGLDTVIGPESRILSGHSGVDEMLRHL